MTALINCGDKTTNVPLQIAVLDVMKNDFNSMTPDEISVKADENSLKYDEVEIYRQLMSAYTNLIIRDYDGFGRAIGAIFAKHHVQRNEDGESSVPADFEKALEIADCWGYKQLYPELWVADG